jgi:hypothetical protein
MSQQQSDRITLQTVFPIPFEGLTQILVNYQQDVANTRVSADAPQKEKNTAYEHGQAIVKKGKLDTNAEIRRIMGLTSDKQKQVSLLREMRKELIQTGMNKARRGQFVLIVDGTSSMQPFMNNLKEIINDLIRTNFIKLFRHGFSMAICVYRDSPMKTKTSPTFVFDGLESHRNARLANERILDDINKFMNENFVATGGDDVPEWLNSGLYEGLYNTKWDEQAAVKMVFVMTDAPNHGILNHGGVVADTYPKGLTSNGKNDTDQAEIRNFLREFSRDDSMYLSFFKLLPDPGSGFKIMDQMLSAMYDNWLSIMREIDSNSLSRFSSYQIKSSTTRSPEVMTVIRDSIMKTVFGSIEMSDANAPERSKKEMTSISATKMELMLEAIDEGLLDNVPLPKSRKGGHLRNIIKRSYKRSNKK